MGRFMRMSQSECRVEIRNVNFSTDMLDRSWVHGITGKMRGKLLLDMLGTIIEDYEFLWDQYYFPTATM